jgi:hypothetical protein
VCATTCSPGFAFFESTDELSTALITAPLGNDASLLAFCDGDADCPAAPAAAQNVASVKAIAKDLMDTSKDIFDVWRLECWLETAGVLRVGRNVVQIDLRCVKIAIRRRLYDQEQTRAALQVHLFLRRKQNRAVRSL